MKGKPTMREIELFVPGRLCLFGEHADWAGEYRRVDPRLPPGYCLAVGTDQGIYATAHPQTDGLTVVSTLPNGQRIGPFHHRMEVSTLRAAARGGDFHSYCAGVACYMQEHYGVGGLFVNSPSMDLPIRKGLSSSAAICVLMARAFNRAYDLGLTIRQEMEAAYQGEIMALSRCGRMDQVCAYGGIPVFLTFDGDEMEIEKVIPQKRVPMVIVDLKEGKDTRKILADLNACFPDTEGEVAAGVRRALGPVNQRILFQARQALEAGDGQALGQLMSEAQTIFDTLIAPACLSQLIAPKLHRVLAHPAAKELAWGGKGVGSQGDGSAQFVARGPEEQRELMHRLSTELDVACLPLTIEARTGDQDVE